MKENEAPEKIWLGKSTQNLMLFDPNSNTYVEYIRKDAFIEKVCEYLMDYEFNDSPTIADRRKRVDEFKKYMKEE